MTKPWIVVGALVAACNTHVNNGAIDATGLAIDAPHAHGDGAELDDAHILPPTDADTEMITGSMCSTDHFCWTNAHPQGNNLRAVATQATDDVWVAGLGGTALHWNGAAWSHADAQLHDEIDQLAYAGSDLWAIGVGGAFRWNGAAWTQPTGAPTTQQVAFVANTATDLWTLGGNIVTHDDGASWTSSGLGSAILYALASSGAGDVWAFGYQGTSWHFTGGSWHSVAAPSTDTLTTAFASSTNDVWATGGLTLWHWTGPWASTSAPCLVEKLWGTAATDVWGVCQRGQMIHYDGAGWTTSRAADGVDASASWSIGGSGADVWAAGPAGRILHRPAGGAWTEVDQGATSQLLYAIDGDYAVGAGAVVAHRSGETWTLDTTPAAGIELHGVWQRGGTDIWLGGLGTLLHYDGATWTSSTYGGVMAMTGLPNGDGWLATQTTVAHFDGSSWTDLPAPPRGNLNSIWASAANDVWVAGTRNSAQVAALCHWDAQAWTCFDGISDDLFQISGVPGGVVYAVGGANVVRYDASQWTQVTGLPAGNTWGSVAVVSATDVYLGNNVGGVAHYDGAQWTMLATGSTQPALQLRATSLGLWDVGFGGSILYRAAI